MAEKITKKAKEEAERKAITAEEERFEEVSSALELEEDEPEYSEEFARPQLQISPTVKKVAIGIGVIACTVALGVLLVGGSPSDAEPNQAEKDTLQTTFDNALAEMASDEVVEPTFSWDTMTPTLTVDQFNALRQSGAFLPDHGDGNQLDRFVTQVIEGDAEARTIMLYDNRAEDGDIIEVSINGVNITVPIWHEPTTVVFPFNPNGDNTMTIRGAVDGGGGVTVAALDASGNNLAMPWLGVGASFQMQVR